jgi:hypothetical protein
MCVTAGEGTTSTGVSLGSPTCSSSRSRGGARTIEGRVDAVGDERERGCTLQRQRPTWMMGEHENRNVERRIVAPPAAPALVPGALAAAEHPAAHDVGAHVLDQAVHHVGVGVGLAPVQSVFPPPARGLEHPLVQSQPVLTDRVLEALIRTGDETVERD